MGYREGEKVAKPADDKPANLAASDEAEFVPDLHADASVPDRCPPEVRMDSARLPEVGPFLAGTAVIQLVC
jgi:hypothetical protein